MCNSANEVSTWFISSYKMQCLNLLRVSIIQLDPIFRLVTIPSSVYLIFFSLHCRGYSGQLTHIIPELDWKLVIILKVTRIEMFLASLRSQSFHDLFDQDVEANIQIVADN